jgi:hypothetical protein
LQKALERMISCHSLLDAGDIVLAVDERAVLVRGGCLSGATFIVNGDTRVAVEHLLADRTEQPRPPVVSAEARREIAVISAWLARNASSVRLLYASGSWVSPSRSRPQICFTKKA